MLKLEGTAASQGFAQAPAFLLPTREDPLRASGEAVPFIEGQTNTHNEKQRLAYAREMVAQHLDDIRHKAARILSPQQAQIFESHKMLLYDVGIFARMEKEIDRGPHTAERAIQLAFRTYEGFVRATEHESFQLKLQDLEDVWRQVMSCLRTGQLIPEVQPQQDVILVAEQFYPSQFTQLPLQFIKGLLTGGGAAEGAVAELARALNIPYFCQVQEIEQITHGAQLVLDGMAGLLLLTPQEQVIEAYSSLADRWHNQSNRQMMLMRSLPSETRCGRPISLRAEIKSAHDLNDATEAGASGIGDLCTASLFLEHGDLPSEAEQTELYLHFIEHTKPSRVAFRTLDLRYDRQLPQLPMPEEANPLLGWRGIRVTLAHRRLLLAQLKALLRASRDQPIRIVLPTVSSSEELEDVSLLLDEAFQDIQAEEPGRMTQYQLGISVETVAAAMQLDLFASRLDFVSIDTDSLLQMVMAAERGNPRLLHLLSPMQPAFVRFLFQLCTQARQTRLSLLARGSMASEPLCIPFLLGLGFRELSVAPHMLPNVKKRLRRIELESTVELTQQALRRSNLQDIVALAHEYAEALPPEDAQQDAEYIRDVNTARAQVQQAITASGASPKRTDDITAKEP